ncbi:MAG: endonuclease [Pedobacter sp.]|nr:MAG: endonuclease [Pedobacter sp.]
MALYQLPRLKNEKKFEEFICDLFNEIENTDSFQNTEYQNFGVKGQQQKGIDIFSAKTKTVIQCKLKDIAKKDEIIRKSLIEDIHSDLKKAFDLQFEISRFIFVSTFRDDSQLQEFTSKLQAEARLPFPIHYWGWDTLSKYAEQYESILLKYFPKLIPKSPKSPKKPAIMLPEGSLGLDLYKKNYIAYLSRRYGDWKQFQFDHQGNGEKFNWASHNRSLMNRYHASGINYIPVDYFDDLAEYLRGRIDKTIFGKSQQSKGRRNYSTFEEHMQGIVD